MSSIFESIKDSQSAESENTDVIAGNNTDQEVISIIWLIFSVHEKLYAIEAPSAKEILRNMNIYPLPFVPDYIKGVINRHGDPYTVVDLASFLGEAPQETSLFIVLNLPDSQFCVQITDILDFHTDSKDAVIKLTDVQDAAYFTGTIEYHNQNIPIIQLETIYEFIRNELGSRH